MTINDIPNEIVVLTYLDANWNNEVDAKNIRENLGRTYIKAFGKLYYKFGGEIDIVNSTYIKTNNKYIINEYGKENLETWKENHKELANELNGIYLAKFLEIVL